MPSDFRATSREHLFKVLPHSADNDSDEDGSDGMTDSVSDSSAEGGRGSRTKSWAAPAALVLGAFLGLTAVVLIGVRHYNNQDELAESGSPEAVLHGAEPGSETKRLAQEVLGLYLNGGSRTCPDCQCDCSWATSPGVCAAQANDGHCCWRCCCSQEGVVSSGYGYPPDSSYNGHNFQVGETATLIENGQPKTVQVLAYLGQGQYRVRYIDNLYGYVDHSRQASFWDSIWVWVIIAAIVLAAGILGWCMNCRKSSAT
mmetsp:Transcript_52753/g.112606  ORF Transcript_52753/g.112606 Transcript_52753/m.112606 type:complete len:257 (-) Transcript_52753:224-994(-)|eukprot:CAMPEP_0206502508 /NCGR_PEP_ID=MMETSP0324_2-20121206/54043_1 /ASSEMBLY_ACC=CAM_ASM_000836 /TAXON_ID=2866 /ORGANISM="Crypthecodinium cohnii, Strain Seligo" /LENGTH=256 /DNA_ID=CAMNT_0053990723 /DNA_START=196 /DNA_END=966 /DNA_ORIENTATION=-